MRKHMKRKRKHMRMQHKRKRNLLHVERVHVKLLAAVEQLSSRIFLMLTTMLFDVFSTDVAMVFAKSAPGMVGGLPDCVGSLNVWLIGWVRMICCVAVPPPEPKWIRLENSVLEDCFCFCFLVRVKHRARVVVRCRRLRLTVQFLLVVLVSMLGQQFFCSSQRCLFGCNLEVSAQLYHVKT